MGVLEICRVWVVDTHSCHWGGDFRLVVGEGVAGQMQRGFRPVAERGREGQEGLVSRRGGQVWLSSGGRGFGTVAKRGGFGNVAKQGACYAIPVICHRDPRPIRCH